VKRRNRNEVMKRRSNEVTKKTECRVTRWCGSIVGGVESKPRDRENDRGYRVGRQTLLTMERFVRLLGATGASYTALLY